MRPLVILDYRVLAFKVIEKLDSIPARNSVTSGFTKIDTDEDLQEIFLSNVWPYIINKATDTVNLVNDGFTCVVVDDYKKPYPSLDKYELELLQANKNGIVPSALYWRNLYYPEYKHGRKDKPANYNSVLERGYRYVKNPRYPGFYLSKELYEADDWAGSIVAYKRLCQSSVESGCTDEVTKQIANRKILLVTVDSDWLQLVGDGVTWHNTGIWEPRIRDSQEAIEWWNRKREHKKHQIRRPYGIVDGKVVLGDKSDNLPPNSPRYLIDLTNPPKRFNLRVSESSIIHQVLTSNINSVTLNHFEIAKNNLLAKSLPLPC